MRENIGLFRGKRKDNGEWVEGNLLTPNEVFDNWCISCVDYLNEYGDIGCLELEVDPDTIGECTGVIDTNAVEMAEGDIVEGLFLFGLPIRAVVTFRDGAFGLEWDRGKVKEFNAFTSICNVRYTIIGNVTDNPELLKGGEG